MALQSGDIVDRYLLQDRLGAGSFGEVWKASQLVDSVDVGIQCAVKLMKLTQDATGSSPRSVASGWLEEVRNLLRVGGDAIPRIHEANVWNGHAYIAMELLEGITLGSRLAHGAIPWRRALYIADQIARALEVAHQLDIIHRDLKPQNVMLVGLRRVCVIDWGIARLKNSTRDVASGVARQPTDDVDTTDDVPVAAIVAPPPQRTAVGTPGYMAPEVYVGAQSTFAQDVYALGVVLYEMIAGCLPYAVEPPGDVRTADSIKTYRASLDKATMDYALVPLRHRCPEAPKLVAQLVDLMLAREPERRPQRPRNAIEAVSRFPDGVPDPPYAGLGRLGREHAGLYFGQKDAIKHILERLESQPGALLWGPSGSGKSSLALAGVASAMDRQLFMDTDGWDIHVVRPREAQGFRVVSEGTLSRLGSIGQVVVIDQLEEIVDLEPVARDVFGAAVLALLERSAPVLIRDTVIDVASEVRVIATIRDDLEWLVDREMPVLRPLLERRIIVKGVDANFARSMIEGPALALDYEVEGIETVSREVEEYLAADPAKLPVVQYALSEWWERKDEAHKVLPAAAWRELGGVDGALSFVAEQFFAILDLTQRLRLRALFVQLFHDGRKQPLAESALTVDERLMMEELIALRLVGRREKKGSAPFFEVEHESLAEYWRRLAGWLAEARVDQALTKDLERDANAYLRDHDPDRLWKRGRIAAVMEMVRRGRIVLSGNATQFLKHARRRALRGRLAGVGIALVLSAAWILLFNEVTSEQRIQLKDEWRKASKAQHEAAADQEKASQDVKDALEEADAASVKVEQYRQRERSAYQKMEEAQREAQNQAQLVKEAKAQYQELLAKAPANMKRDPSVKISELSPKDITIRSKINTKLQEIQDCYEKQLLAKPSLAGTVQARFFIKNNGKVASSTADGVDGEVSRCFAGVIEGIEFPPQTNGSVQVTFMLKS